MNKQVLDLLKKYNCLNTVVINSTDKALINELKNVYNILLVEEVNELSIIYILSDDEMDKSLSIFMDDFNYEFKYVSGIHFTKNTNLEKAYELVSLLKDYFKSSNSGTSLIDLFTSTWNNSKEFIEKFYYLNLYRELENNELKDIIKIYFNNNLNVLKTSKDLFLSRGSLFFKFDRFFRETSLDLTKFIDCTIVLMYLQKYSIN